MVKSRIALAKNGRAFFLEKLARHFCFAVRRGTLPQIKGEGVVCVRSNRSKISSPRMAFKPKEASNFSASGERELQATVKGVV